MIVHMIGNSHIDPIWLWRWEAGLDEAVATFSSAVQRCDEYPDFIYTRGEAWLYQQVERVAPDLFVRVRDLIAAGRWHVTGGQYIQPDANGPTAEGWRRQHVHGLRYFADNFGVRPTVGYNVDTFGHAATIPDMLAPLGYRAYVFSRPSERQVALPAQTFRWRGPGGAELLGFHITEAYLTHVPNLYHQVMAAVEAADPVVGHTMCFYGVGNHGGAPTKANIEYIIAHAHAFDGIELRFSTPEAFVDAIMPQRERMPVVTEELQHCFPGCYSVMHTVRQSQRRDEHLLEQCARTVDRLVDDPGERQALQEKVDRAWDDLLFTQFHDVLSGTSIPSAYPSVRAMQGRAQITGEEIITRVTRRWARAALPRINQQQIVLYNPDGEAWDGMVETEPFLDFDSWGDRWISDVDGKPVPLQHVQPEGGRFITRILVPAAIAAGAATQLLVRDDACPESAPFVSDLSVSTTHLANKHLSIALGSKGIAGIAVAGEPVLGGEGVRLHLRTDHSNTWGARSDRFDEPVEAVFATDSWVVEETGPLRARVRAEGRLGGSPIRWTLTLHAGEPRLYMQLETIFSEHYRLLQMPIDLATPPQRWTAGLAGGHMERVPSPIEWPVQGWSVAHAGGQDIALLTADAYSASLDGTHWQWTLLRTPRMAWGGDSESPVYAGRDWFADQGEQAFEIALQFGAHLQAGDLERAARQQVQAPIVFDRYEGMNRPAYGDNPPDHVLTWTEDKAKGGRAPTPEV
jgi:alpha-mannosidase